MTVDAPSAFVPPKPASGGLTRRGLIKTGLGLTGLAGIVLPGTAAYAAMEAANGLSITDYRLTPPGWPSGQRLTIAVIADLHAGGPNMGATRVRQVVDAANTLACDLVVLLGDYFATTASSPKWCRRRSGPPNWRGYARRSASMRFSAITTGGTASNPRARRWRRCAFR
jgi:hypothetical protein